MGTMAKPYIKRDGDGRISRMRGTALQRRRLAMWTEDPCCKVCQRLTAWPNGFERDHVMPLELGGLDDASNEQLLCIACHAEKSNTDQSRVGSRPSFTASGAVVWDDPKQVGAASHGATSAPTMADAPMHRVIEPDALESSLDCHNLAPKTHYAQSVQVAPTSG